MYNVISKLLNGKIIVPAIVSAFAFVQSSALATVRVTEGQVYQYSTNTFTITSSPATRFEFVGSSGDKILIRALYQGPTAQKSYLADGSYVSQIALKMRNKNPCNLVYVSRRIYPTPAIVISLKTNSGMTTSSQCGDRGYHWMGSIAMPWIPVGTTFDLGGSFVGNTLTVTYNGRAVWRGYIPFNAGGDVGLRTDNTKAVISRLG